METETVGIVGIVGRVGVGRVGVVRVGVVTGLLSSKRGRTSLSGVVSEE